MDKESREKLISKLSLLIFRDLAVSTFEYYCQSHTEEEQKELKENIETQIEAAEMVILLNKLSDQIS